MAEAAGDSHDVEPGGDQQRSVRVAPSMKRKSEAKPMFLPRATNPTEHASTGMTRSLPLRAGLGATSPNPGGPVLKVGKGPVLDVG
jgi:hypothetical protein